MQSRVLSRLLVCWGGALLLLSAISLSFDFYSFYVSLIIALFSLPFLSVAILVAVPFARSVVHHPELWSLAAVSISSAVSVAIGAGLIATVVAVPAALAFVVWMRLRPIDRRAA